MNINSIIKSRDLSQDKYPRVHSLAFHNTDEVTIGDLVVAMRNETLNNQLEIVKDIIGFNLDTRVVQLLYKIFAMKANSYREDTGHVWYSAETTKDFIKCIEEPDNMKNRWEYVVRRVDSSVFVAVNQSIYNPSMKIPANEVARYRDTIQAFKWAIKNSGIIWYILGNRKVDFEELILNNKNLRPRTMRALSYGGIVNTSKLREFIGDEDNRQNLNYRLQELGINDTNVCEDVLDDIYKAGFVKKNSDTIVYEAMLREFVNTVYKGQVSSKDDISIEDLEYFIIDMVNNDQNVNAFISGVVLGKYMKMGKTNDKIITRFSKLFTYREDIVDLL